MTATPSSILKAATKAARRLNKEPNTYVACAESAGFVFAPGQKRGQKEGYQITVKVERYSDAFLKSHPLSGGLLNQIGD
jgi:hypothetical protein